MEAIGACRGAGATIPSVFASRLVTCERTQCSLRGASHFRLLRSANRKSVTIVAAAKENREALQSLSTVVTDDAVPEGHKGLHGFLYGEGGAEVHGTAGGEFRGRENEDDGNAILPFDSYISARESFKFAGVFAIYSAGEKLEYISYSRNVVSTLKSLRARVGDEKCSAVRVKMYTEAALITRAKLEEEKQRWLDSVGVPPGNSTEKASWEGSGNAMSEQEKIEYEEKKLKMRKAMGENLFDDVAGEDDDARTRRLKLLQAVEGDDWSSVIDGQTKQTIEAPVAEPVAETVAEESVIVSPFASGSQTSGGLYSAETYVFTMENVDKVLDEVRPYLIADGGNVEVVSVKDGVVSLRLQGACGTCPSSTSTMKMGIERVLMEKFGDMLKEVVQVDKQQIGATVSAIDAHLEMLRPAIRNYGGSVEVVSVDTETGECQVKYQGPAPIGMGIQAAIKDKFPDVKQVDLLPVDSNEMDSTTKESKTSEASNNDLTTLDSISEEPTFVNPITEDFSSSKVSQSKFGFQSPGLGSWLGVTLLAVWLITAAFLPSLVPPPVRILCDAVGPPQLWQSFFYLAVFFHVLEASYALYLAQELDPKNQALWFWQTFYLGFLSLTFLLHRKAKQ